MKFKNSNQRKAVMSKIKNPTVIGELRKDLKTKAKKPTTNLIAQASKNLSTIKKELEKLPSSKEKTRLMKRVNKDIEKSKSLQKNVNELNKIIRKRGLTEKDEKRIRKLNFQIKADTIGVSSGVALAGLGVASLTPATMIAGYVAGAGVSAGFLKSIKQPLLERGKLKRKFKKQQL